MLLTSLLFCFASYAWHLISINQINQEKKNIKKNNYYYYQEKEQQHITQYI